MAEVEVKDSGKGGKERSTEENENPCGLYPHG